MELKKIESEHPFSISLDTFDEKTVSEVSHRALLDNGNTEVLTDYLVPLVKKHHIDDEALKRRIEQITNFRINNLTIPNTLIPYPQDTKTQKGNFTEIFLAEYLEKTTNANIPVYRLRYNTNVAQSMKGDDVLLFDLDSEPPRVIVGEAKFRKTPEKESVLEMIEGLVRSSNVQLPVSLMFVTDRLYEQKQNTLAKKVEECTKLIAMNQLNIEYVGLLMSNKNAKKHINRYATSSLHNLLMISLGMENPEKIVTDTFSRLKEEL